MRIAIVSDTHNQYQRVREVVRLCRQRAVDAVLHCGDIEDPATVRLFTGLPTHYVFGNNDTDKDGLRRAMAESGATVQEPYGCLEVEGKKLAWVHGDHRDVLRDLERADAFDYIFHGHTHQAVRRQAGPATVINPGALHRASVKTFVMLDLATDEVERFEIR